MAWSPALRFQSPPPCAGWQRQLWKSDHLDSGEGKGLADPCFRSPTGTRKQWPRLNSWRERQPFPDRLRNQIARSLQAPSPEPIEEAMSGTRPVPSIVSVLVREAQSRFPPEDPPAPNRRRRSFPHPRADRSLLWYGSSSHRGGAAGCRFLEEQFQILQFSRRPPNRASRRPRSSAPDHQLRRWRTWSAKSGARDRRSAIAEPSRPLPPSSIGHRRKS